MRPELFSGPGPLSLTASVKNLLQPSGARQQSSGVLFLTPLFITERKRHYIGRTGYLESQWLIIMGYFKPIMVYFGV